MTGFDLTGRRGLVTGAAGAIGAACVEALAAAGARLVASDRPGLGGLVGADLADPIAAERLVAQALATLGGLDLLVLAHGVAHAATLDETTDADWERVLAINLSACFRLCRAAAAALRASGRGRVLLMGSVVAHQGATMGHVAYAASKGGLHALGKTMARTLAADRVTVNMIAPGPTDTAMLRAAHPEDERRAIAGRIPLGLAEVADIAGAVVYLASDAARHITGATIDVNGGFLMR